MEAAVCKTGSGALHTSSEVSFSGQQLLGHLGHGCSLAAAASGAAHILTGSLCMGCYSKLPHGRYPFYPEASGQVMVYALHPTVPDSAGEFSLGPTTGWGFSWHLALLLFSPSLLSLGSHESELWKSLTSHISPSLFLFFPLSFLGFSSSSTLLSPLLPFFFFSLPISVFLFFLIEKGSHNAVLTGLIIKLAIPHFHLLRDLITGCITSLGYEAIF